MSDDPAKVLDRDVFAARLAAAGIVLDAEEFEAVYGTANWVETGLAGLKVPKDEGTADQIDESLADLSLIDAGRWLRDGSLTSVALTDACLARIKGRDGSYQAFYEVFEATARAAAREADAAFAAGNDLGPLHGIPVGLKDLIDIAGVRTTAGSRGRADAVPTQNATVVDRLIAGGAVIIGKLATYEWATVGPAWDTLHPPAKNPWSLSHITGGSSSGSAAAVAGGLVRISIGTDTGGSVRGPSSYCGTVGLKPTFGLVPMDGILPLSPSMDHPGVIAASSAEAAMTLDVIAGTSAAWSATRYLGESLQGVRIGYARDWFAEDPAAAPDLVAAMDEAASVLSERGALVNRVQLPDYGPAEVAAAAVLLAESFALHRQGLTERAESYGRKTYQSLVAGAAISQAQLDAARAAGRQFQQELDRVLADYDVVITACALTPALPLSLFGKGSVWTPMRTIPFNLSGHPAMSVPIGFSDGLPLGMQIVGKAYDEARICQVGAAFELATDFTLQRPAQPPR